MDPDVAGKAKILLVDDRPENLLALEAALEPLDQDLVKANSGEEALRMLLKQEFAVILLDVQMPGIDGFETATEIKKRDKTKDIPIIFLTAISREPHHALRGYSTGAVDYLAKPFDPWVLRAKVAVFVDLYEKNNLLKQQAELLAQRLKERERAEAALEEKAQELERSNADLAQFAYVASHDLQEPLRVMSGYLGLLRDSYGEDASEETSMFIGRIENAIGRMDTLIRDLLSFARVGTSKAEFQPTDCNDIIDHALGNLEIAIKEADASIERSDLPTVRADQSQMVQLFQNLVGNAIKFRDEEPPRISVKAEPKGQEWMFSVKDNGIGIEPEYVDRIFTIFERLNSAETYPGSGIGLSVCKRIVERHGGKIWAASKPGDGTCIFFTLKA